MMVPTETSAQKKQAVVMRWKIAGELPASPGQQQALGFAGPVTGIHQQVLMVAGGANFPDGMPWEGGKKKYYDDIYIYRRKRDKLLLQNLEAKLPAAIAYAATCSTPQGVIYAGGENEKGISNKSVLLQWNEETNKITTKKIADLPLALTNASATINNNIVYIAGGETTTGASDKFYSIELNDLSAGWTALQPLPVPVSNMVMVALANEKHASVYISGGRKKNTTGTSDLYNTVYAFDIEKNQWRKRNALPYPLTAGTGIAIGSHHILLFGGDKGESFHQSELLAEAIKDSTDEIYRQQLIKKKNDLQAAHPGFSKTVLMYDAITDKWSSIDTIPFPARATTIALKWDDLIIIPGGEIRAGVRTPLILSATINAAVK